MRRVVVTGMGIVSSIGNNTQEVLASLREAKSGDRPRRQIRRAWLPISGARRADARRQRGGRPPRHALSRRRRGLEPRRHGAGDPRRRARTTRNLATNAPGSSWAPAAPSTRAIVESADIARTKGPKRVGPFAVPKAMSSTASATLGDLVQDQGRQLFDLVGLRDVQSLHRQRLRADSKQQAGHDVCRRLRGA